MENQWFYAVNDTQHGPVRVEDLYQKFTQGILTNESLVWQQGMDNWIPLKEVTILQTAFDALKPKDNTQSQWFYAIGNTQYGAVSADEIRQKIKNGILNAQSLVWRQGLSEWIALCDCSEFAEALSNVPPQIPKQNKLQTITQNNKTSCYAAYACFLASILVPFMIIAALLVAYITDDDTQSALTKSHLAHIRKQSWISILLAIIGVLTILIGIGIFILIALDIYILVIGIIGIIRLNENRLST